jgi:hypothetical protein
LIVRDGGCRFPGCTQPVERCDTHHIVGVAGGGATTLPNLVLVCRDHHHAIHDSAWHATLHADVTMTFTRRGITLTSQPRTRQHPTPTRPPPPGRPRRTSRSRGQPPEPEPRPRNINLDHDVDVDTADPTRQLLPF